MRGAEQCKVVGYSASGIRLVSALIEKAASDASWMLDNVGQLKNFFDVHAGGKAGLTKAVLDDKNWEMATRTNQLFFKAMKSLRSVASRSALPTNMDSKKRIA